jgi:hypothetical protein
MFKPDNDLEALMQGAAKEPRRASAFYKKLLESEIYILTPDTPMRPGQRRSLKYKEPLNIATVEFQGLKWLPTFTSKRRISDYVKEPEVCFGAVAKDLFEMLPESNFWLNPLGDCQKPIPASEVALLLNGRIFDVVADKA